MSIPFDQRLSKLRLLLRRADTRYAEQKRIYDDIVEKAYEPVHLAGEERVRIFTEFMSIAKELGYCGGCEKTLHECNCVWLARAATSATESR